VKVKIISPLKINELLWQIPKIMVIIPMTTILLPTFNHPLDYFNLHNENNNKKMPHTQFQQEAS